MLETKLQNSKKVIFGSKMSKIRNLDRKCEASWFDRKCEASWSDRKCCWPKGYADRKCLLTENSEDRTRARPKTFESRSTVNLRRSIEILDTLHQEPGDRTRDFGREPADKIRASDRKHLETDLAFAVSDQKTRFFNF